jgi:predicted enzyme related to lactoylglutathione lyase
MVRTKQPYARGELVIVVDVADLGRAADFWGEVLGYVQDGDASGRYLSLVPADGNGIEVLLQKVDDEKRGKNRLHLDLRTQDLDAEVDRVRALGASMVTEEPIVESGWTWHVLADPDGNEFCVLQRPSRQA